MEALGGRERAARAEVAGVPAPFGDVRQNGGRLDVVLVGAGVHLGIVIRSLLLHLVLASSGQASSDGTFPARVSTDCARATNGELDGRRGCRRVLEFASVVVRVEQRVVVLRSGRKPRADRVRPRQTE